MVYWTFFFFATKDPQNMLLKFGQYVAEQPVYRAPAGDFELLINKLQNITNYLHKLKAEIITCGDINW
jgi:hypothetical protein